MDPFTLALATFGVQKLRGKSTGRSFRDALMMGGIGQLGSMAGMPGMQGFGQGAGQLAGSTMGAQLRNTTAANLALGQQATMPAQGSAAFAKMGSIPPTAGGPVKSGSEMLSKAGKWWGGLDTGSKIGIGLSGATLAGGLMEDDTPAKFDEAPYTKAYDVQKKLTSGLSKKASYGAEPLYSNQNLYSYKTGGLASLPVQKFAEGGINYMPSKMTHDDKDYSNYIKADGYIEDGSGAGDKNKDTILAQLADGEFVSRGAAILGAGIIEGASPKDEKDMRKKGADFFYKQQAKFKRIFDLLDASKKRIN
jgi:hypothetical protein